MEVRFGPWMYGTLLKDKVPSLDLRKRMGIELVIEVVKRNQWLGHAVEKDDDDWVKRSILYEVDGVRGRGRPRMTLNQMVEREMRERVG